MEQKKSEDLVRRFAAALRGTALYAPAHPLVLRGIDAQSTAAIEGLQAQPSILVAFIGGEIRHVQLGRIVVEETDVQEAGIAPARKVYSTAIETAETLWQAAKAGDNPDPGAPKKIIGGRAKLVTQDLTSLMARAVVEAVDPEEAGIDPLKYLDATV
jgi:hypothetical protein